MSSDQSLVNQTPDARTQKFIADLEAVRIHLHLLVQDARHGEIERVAAELQQVAPRIIKLSKEADAIARDHRIAQEPPRLKPTTR